MRQASIEDDSFLTQVSGQTRGSDGFFDLLATAWRAIEYANVLPDGSMVVLEPLVRRRTGRRRLAVAEGDKVELFAGASVAVPVAYRPTTTHNNRVPMRTQRAANQPSTASWNTPKQAASAMKSVTQQSAA
jgi:hypothetical protein